MRRAPFVLGGALLIAGCSGSRRGGDEPAVGAPATATGVVRLLDRFDEWTVDSDWDPQSTARPEAGLAPTRAFEFDDGTLGGLADARLAGAMPGSPPPRAGAKPSPGTPPRACAEAAGAGAGGLRFDRASGVAFAILPLEPDTPYVFSARTRRALDPADFAAGADAEARAANAARLTRDASVGSIVLLELNQLPAGDASLDALFASFARRENAMVAPHVLQPSGRGEWREERLEFKSSIFTHAIVVGLIGGNPGWWQLESSARDVDAAPDGAVDFDEVRLFELPLARWLATATSRAQDELPCGGADARVRKVHLLEDARRALLAPPGTTASVPLALPRGRFRLDFGYGVLGERRPGFGTLPVEFVATLERDGAPPHELLRRSVRAAESAEASAWQEFAIEADGDGGAARLVLATRGDVGRGEVAAFAEPRLGTLRAPAELPLNVLLISIDTLRADRLGCQGYARADGEATTPGLDAFARESLRFANARSVAPFTLPAHATMFTGLSPRVHGVTRQGRRLTSGVHPLLAEEFAAAGYATGAFTGGAFVSYEHGFHHGFDRYSILDPFLTSADPYRDAFPRPGDRPWNDAAYAHHDRAAIERWVDAQAGRPFFLFVHTYVAHNYHPPVAIERRFVRGDPGAVLGPARDLKWLDLNVAAAETRIAPAVARLASDVYDAAVAAADADVAALLEGLRGRGLLDRTVVAIVSDHGEEFGEHGGLLHGRTLYEELLRIPFLLRVPGVAPAVVEAPVDLADLAPTLRQAAGLAAAPRCDGRSVLDRLRDDGFAESFWAEVTAPGLSRRYALRSGRFKLIETPDSRFEEVEYAARRPPEFELFDLAADRGERANLVLLDIAGASGRAGVRPDPEQPAALAGMRRALAQRRAELDGERAALLPDARALEYLTGGDAQRLLRELGYAAGGGDAEGDE